MKRPFGAAGRHPSPTFEAQFTQNFTDRTSQDFPLNCVEYILGAVDGVESTAGATIMVLETGVIIFYRPPPPPVPSLNDLDQHGTQSRR